MKAIPLLMIFVPLAIGPINGLRADQVVMQNGDKYVGTVLSLTTNLLVLQNENLGNITLPRSKINAIVLGTGAAANHPLPAGGSNVNPRPAASPASNAVADLPAALRSLRSQTNLIQQVQSHIIGSAGPEATDKFNELLDGLSTGKITLDDLRAQAQSVTDQLRELKRDLGPEVSGELESYLAVLDNFLKDTAPPRAATNSSPSILKSTGDAARASP
ncbi:MAG TPA: hypothetical protein VMB80_11145 [Candidatus Acidoferrum sp.]|nr:hypothetical protein [Candidatus Acidoferrum sp.]